MVDADLTEDVWLKANEYKYCFDHTVLLRRLNWLNKNTLISERKWRLHMAACMDAFLHRVAIPATYLDHKKVVVAVRQFVEGQLSRTKLKKIAWGVQGPEIAHLTVNDLRQVKNIFTFYTICATKDWPYGTDQPRWVPAPPADEYFSSIQDAYAKQVKLLYDIVGNPFRPWITPHFDNLALNLPEEKRTVIYTFKSEWLTKEVIMMAQALFNNSNYKELPYLADALTDTGCDNDELLQHLRSGCDHVQGCWAVDLILGKR